MKHEDVLRHDQENRPYRNPCEAQGFMPLRIGGAGARFAPRYRRSETVQLFDLSKKGCNSRFRSLVGHTNRQRSGGSEALSVQYNDCEALFLLQLRDLHAPSAPFERKRLVVAALTNAPRA
jgi:hypothetical protein